MTLPDLPPVEGVRSQAYLAELAYGRGQMVVDDAVPAALEALRIQYHIGSYAEATTMDTAATASMAPQLVAVEPSITAEPGAIDPMVARQAVDAAYGE